MSDPVTNAEVEDVLSSIRRLVSEDKRPVLTAKAEATTAAFKQPAESGNDRLVLTPALRVTEKSSETADPADTADDVAPSLTAAVNVAPAVTPEPDASASLFDTTPDANDSNDAIAIGSLVSDDTLFEMPQSLATTEQSTDADIIQNLTRNDDPAEEDGQILSDPSQDYSTDPYNFDDDADSDGEGDEEYLKRFVAAQRGLPDDFEDEDFDEVPESVSEAAILSEPEAAAEQQAVTEQGARKDAASPQANSEATPLEERMPEPQTSNSPTSDTPEAATKAAVLTAKIAALETAIGQIAETWEPDEAGEGDYAGSEAEAMEWEDDEQEMPLHPEDGTAIEKPAETANASETETKDAASEEVFAKPDPVAEPSSDADLMDVDWAETADAYQAEPVDDAAYSETVNADPTHEEPTAVPIGERLGYSEEDQLIDEEALRDLVSDIVRQELQGALGERITRNVRKLVRREIHRALAAQDLE